MATTRWEDAGLHKIKGNKVSGYTVTYRGTHIGKYNSSEDASKAAQDHMDSLNKDMFKEMNTPAKPINPSLLESITKVLGEEVKQFKHSGTTVRAGVDYDFAVKNNQDPYFTVTHSTKDTAGIASKKHLIDVAHNDPDKLHHLMAIKKMHLRSAIDGSPMHAKPNAHYHAGIGTHSQRNPNHLASHLDIPIEHAHTILSQVDSVNGDDSKRKIVDAHIEDLKPRWKQDALHAHAALEQLKS